MFERKDMPHYGEDRTADHVTPSKPWPKTIMKTQTVGATTAPELPQEYTVGFIFCPRFEIVALMRKNRPAWQAGKLNGIGGKFEAVDNNNPRVCMLREATEEAVWEHKPLGGELRSYELDKLPWKQFARIAGKKNLVTHQRLWVVHCFYTTAKSSFRTITAKS